MFGRKPANPPLTERDKSKAAYHIERFARALEQCQNLQKRPELERNLAYWTRVKALEEDV